MIAAGADPQEPGSEAGGRRAGRRQAVRKTAWVLTGLSALAVAGLVCGAVAGARYEPLAAGDPYELPIHALAGLPAGRGIIPVNTFGRYRQDIYVPPQRGPFSLFVTVENNGSRPVTIVSVAPPSGLQSAGVARYLAPAPHGEAGRQLWRVLRNYQLGPGDAVEVGMPVRTWPCAQLDGWENAPDFEVTMRFAAFTRKVPLPWGSSGDTLIMRDQGGEPGEPATFCLPGTVLPPLPKGSALPGDQLVAVSGMIVRIHHGRTAGDLRLTRIPRPDAAAGYNNPRCLVTRPPGQRLADFDLSWAAIAGQHAPSPAVHLSIAGPHGEPVTALIPQGPEYTRLACRDARSLVLPSQPPGAQFVIGLVLQRPKDEWVRKLLVSVDGHAVLLPLTRACSGRGCFQDTPAVRYQPGTAYSHTLRI